MPGRASVLFLHRDHMHRRSSACDGATSRKHVVRGNALPAPPPANVAASPTLRVLRARRQPGAGLNRRTQSPFYSDVLGVSRDFPRVWLLHHRKVRILHWIHGRQRRSLCVCDQSSLPPHREQGDREGAPGG